MAAPGRCPGPSPPAEHSIQSHHPAPRALGWAVRHQRGKSPQRRLPQGRPTQTQNPVSLDAPEPHTGNNTLEPRGRGLHPRSKPPCVSAETTAGGKSPGPHPAQAASCQHFCPNSQCCHLSSPVAIIYLLYQSINQLTNQQQSEETGSCSVAQADLQLMAMVQP